MDRVNNGGLNSATECFNLPSSNDSEENDYISDIVHHLEGMRHKIFVQASQNIKQAKHYNARQGGIPFKVGDKVLKRNMKDAACKAKMRNRYVGSYVIFDISLSGLYFLRDKYSYKLKRPVPQNQLVQYYGVGGFRKAKVEAYGEVSSNNSSDADMNSSLHQTKTNVGVCHDPLSGSSSDVDMNSSHIPHQAKSNVGVSDYLSSNSLSDVEINSSNISKFL